MCFVCETVVEPPELTYLEYELTAVSDVAQDAEDGDAGEGSKDKLLAVEKRPLMVTMRSAFTKMLNILRVLRTGHSLKC